MFCGHKTLSELLVLSPTASDRDRNIDWIMATGQKHRLRNERMPGLWKHLSSFLQKYLEPAT
jgi:hypothetical protein